MVRWPRAPPGLLSVAAPPKLSLARHCELCFNLKFYGGRRGTALLRGHSNTVPTPAYPTEPKECGGPEHSGEYEFCRHALMDALNPPCPSQADTFASGYDDPGHVDDLGHTCSRQHDRGDAGFLRIKDSSRATWEISNILPLYDLGGEYSTVRVGAPRPPRPILTSDGLAVSSAGPPGFGLASTWPAGRGDPCSFG